MNHYAVLETTQFKVKDAIPFREEIEKLPIDLQVNSGGFTIRQKEESIDEDDIDRVCETIQRHVAEKVFVRVTVLFFSSKQSCLWANIYVINDLGISFKSLGSVFEEMENKFYPRRIIAQASVRNNATKNWIENGKVYVAIKEKRVRNRHHYVVKHDNGHQITWGKEYFYES